MFKLIPSFLALTFLFTSCNFLSLKNIQKHCSLYKYNKQQNQWMDSAGQIKSCTIVDNYKVFPYYPGQGCSYWEDLLDDENTKFTELPIKTQSTTGNIVQIYCIKQQYIALDSSGQVLLIDNGIFCLNQDNSPDKQYLFRSCDGITQDTTKK